MYKNLRFQLATFSFLLLVLAGGVQGDDDALIKIVKEVQRAHVGDTDSMQAIDRLLQRAAAVNYDSLRNSYSLIHQRRKRGWFDDSPGNRATMTPAVIPPSTPPPPPFNPGFSTIPPVTVKAATQGTTPTTSPTQPTPTTQIMESSTQSMESMETTMEGSNASLLLSNFYGFIMVAIVTIVFLFYFE